jgi:hypothetical protein
MKSAATLLPVLAILALVAGSASAASLDRNGTWVPGEFHQHNALHMPRTLINDGSFEQGPPPASAWTEVSNSPACEWIGDFSSAWYMSSWDGYMDYWAGGYCIDEGTGELFTVTSSVAQVIQVPVETTRLSFYYAAFRPDADDVPADGDHVYVAVNGVEVWRLDLVRDNNTYPNWAGPVYVDLEAYAGQSVSLTFGGISVGDVTGNVRFDYIELIPGDPTAVASSRWGSVKALYR